MPDPLTLVNTRVTPQTERADPRQARNNASGHSFVLDDMARLRRFLVLGVQGGTYYVGERELTRENAGLVLELARTRGEEVVAEVLAVSLAGRAPKQQPALFALAAVSGLGSPEAKRAAHIALLRVARTGTHLFTFAGYVEQFRGWGRGLRSAIGGWPSSGDFLSYGNEFQCVRDRHKDGDHEMAEEVWGLPKS